jgi:hypothetical protein
MKLSRSGVPSRALTFRSISDTLNILKRHAEKLLAKGAVALWNTAPLYGEAFLPPPHVGLAKYVKTGIFKMRFSLKNCCKTTTEWY